MSAEVVERKIEYLVDRKGRRKKVVIALKDYEELMEDFEALAVIASRVDEGYISIDEMKRRLYGKNDIQG